MEIITNLQYVLFCIEKLLMIGVRTTDSSHKHLPSVVVKKSRHPFRDRCLPCFSSISFPNDLAKVNINFQNDNDFGTEIGGW